MAPDVSATAASDSSAANPDDIVDLLVIGGGVNGCGIARDAIGRGLSVTLVEKDDLAQATSSASTKLFHGGLRYLEYYEFRLVREALLERETLLQMMPHISWPMRFVLPHHQGLRPGWLLRLGLFLYDHIGGRKILPATKTLNLRKHPVGKALSDAYTKAYEYSDCWVEDARLVVLNARDAANRGARIQTRTLCESAERIKDHWQAVLVDQRSGERTTITAKAIVNAAGPWVEDVLNGRLRQNSSEGVRLVRGSHIVTKRLFEHDQPYIFQQSDGRIIFAIPYETDFTLIGTTDQDHDGDAGQAVCTPEEQDYLINAASGYFKQSLTVDDIVWTYSGVRPLYDDDAKSATAATREYVLSLSASGNQAPLLNVFGGKITTYRKLAEAAMDKLSPYFPSASGDWTAGKALPGGDFPVDGQANLCAQLRREYPFIDERWADRLVKAYGTEAQTVMTGATCAADLGENFGATLTEQEVRWLIDNEWAITADDILWRRSKLGLQLTPVQQSQLQNWLSNQDNDN